MKDHLYPHLSKPGQSPKPAFSTFEIFLPSRVLGGFCSVCDALRSSTGKGAGRTPKRAMAEGLARGHTWGCAEQPRALTIERDRLKLQLLRVAFPEVRSSLPKLAHVQHRHLVRLEGDLAAAIQE